MRRFTAAVTALVMVAALFGAVVQPIAAQGSGTIYTVQPGDNLYRIGLKFGLSADALAKANGIVNPNYVYVGQKLVIPISVPVVVVTSPSTSTPSSAEVVTEAVTEAATQAGAEVTAEVPTEVAPTETTVTPEAGTTMDAGIISLTTPTTTPTAQPAATATSAAPTVAGTIPSTYTVQVRDNLYRISLRFNTNMLTLMQLNNIANPNLIYVGEVLTLPAPAVAVVPTATTVLATQTAGGTLAVTLAASMEATTSAPPLNTAANVGFQFGIAADMSGQDAAKLTGNVKDLGLTWVKLPVAWRKLELTKGAIDTSSLDSQIDALSAGSVNIMLTISSAPDWARSTTVESGPPTDFNDYANFVGALAAKYKGKVQAYEIWNEPNLRREWSGRPLSAASYVELLRLAYNAIKSADSSALVVSAGLAPTGYNDGVNAINDRTFLRQAFTAGLATYSDAVGSHPGGWGNPPDSTCCAASPGVSGWFNDRSFYFMNTIKDYRDIMVQSGHGSIFMWVTEFGWGSSEGVVTDQSQVNPNFGFVKFVSQLQQGQYESRAYQLAKTLGYIGPMFLYNLNYCQTVGTDPTNSEFRGCYYSLLDASGNPRPAYDAIKVTPKQ